MGAEGRGLFEWHPESRPLRLCSSGWKGLWCEFSAQLFSYMAEPCVASAASDGKSLFELRPLVCRHAMDPLD